MIRLEYNNLASHTHTLEGPTRHARSFFITADLPGTPTLGPLCGRLSRGRRHGASLNETSGELSDDIFPFSVVCHSLFIRDKLTTLRLRRKPKESA